MTIWSCGRKGRKGARGTEGVADGVEEGRRANATQLASGHPPTLRIVSTNETELSPKMEAPRCETVLGSATLGTSWSVARRLLRFGVLAFLEPPLGPPAVGLSLPAFLFLTPTIAFSRSSLSHHCSFWPGPTCPARFAFSFSLACNCNATSNEQACPKQGGAPGRGEEGELEVATAQQREGGTKKTSVQRSLSSLAVEFLKAPHDGTADISTDLSKRRQTSRLAPSRTLTLRFRSSSVLVLPLVLPSDGP